MPGAIGGTDAGYTADTVLAFIATWPASCMAPEGAGNWGTVAGSMLDAMIRKNPHILANLPMGDSLAGLFQQPEKTVQIPQGEDAKVSFEKQEVSEDDENWKKYRVQLQSSFTQENLNTVFGIVRQLAQQQELIPKAAELVNLKNE